MSFLFAVSAVVLFGGLSSANARMLRFPTQIQHLVKEPAVVTQYFQPQAMSYPSLETSSCKMFLYVLLGCVCLAVCMFLLSCSYDAAKHWRRMSSFRACKKKVQRVHDVLERNSGELPLCPCCVEFIPSKTSRSTVAFLCGHRFHVACANRWLSEQADTESSNTCPVCESCTITATLSPDEDSTKVAPHEAEGTFWDQQDEAKTFILCSLSKQFPDVIREDCVRRWCQCHTELWLSELKVAPP